MAVRMMDQVRRGFDDLRYHQTEKRVRARDGGSLVADSVTAMLVWEPRRIVPSYAVPADDVLAELLPAGARPAPQQAPPVLHPGIGFHVHTAEGEPLTVRTDSRELAGAAFRLGDAELSGYILLDFAAFDTWLEEDEPILSHPRDPFHRVDVRRSSRHVRVELDGQVLAESTRPRLVFETGLPTRYYLPREDVDTARLQESTTRSRCAYKGEASYWSVDLGGRVEPDLVWTYQQPLPDAVELAGMLAFFDERADVVVDGRRRGRPRTEWSIGRCCGGERPTPEPHPDGA
jgi:uncharacterized protein (DUF427 family)